MPILQITLFLYFGGVWGIKALYFRTKHHKYLQMLSCFPLWAQLSLDAMLEAEHPRHLQGFKSCLPLWCVFLPAQFLSRFRVPCTVKYPYGCWMACSAFEKELLSLSTFLFWEVKKEVFTFKKKKERKEVSFLYQLKRKRTSHAEHAALKPDDEWQDFAIGNTKSRCM